jgi:spermidine synthase
MLTKIPDLPHQWIIDIYYQDMSRAILYQVENIVAQDKSPFQEILVADVTGFGRAVFLDGVAQSSEADEAIYHEALVLPGLLACASPQTVFIAGGGEGAILRELLRHPAVQKIVMVDIDPVMVDLAKKHLYSWHQGKFEDPRVTVIAQDARGYLENSGQLYDYIVVDLADPAPDSPAALLYTQEFYELVKSRLTPGGVLALQAEAMDITDHLTFISIIKTLKMVFRSVIPYGVSIPFFGSSWGFVLASSQPIDERLDPGRIERQLQTIDQKNSIFYDRESHTHMFSLPRYIRTALQDPTVGRILRDNDFNEVQSRNK